MKRLRIVILVVVVVALLLALRTLPIAAPLARFQAYVRAAGPLGYVVYALGYGVVALFFPASVLTIGAGAIFGIAGVTVVVTAGANIAAILGFVLARTVLRSRIEKLAASNKRFAAVDAAIGREGWKIVFLIRLAAIFPFTIVNYLLGLTSIRLVPYIAATVPGILPATIAFVAIGAAGAAAATQDRTRLIFTIAGVMVALGVSIFIGRIAAHAIRRAGVDDAS